MWKMLLSSLRHLGLQSPPKELSVLFLAHCFVCAEFKGERMLDLHVSVEQHPYYNSVLFPFVEFFCPHSQEINECSFKESTSKYNVMKTNVRSIVLTSLLGYGQGWIITWGKRPTILQPQTLRGGFWNTVCRTMKRLAWFQEGLLCVYLALFMSMP